MLSITPAEKTDITRIVCPACGEKVARVGLLKNSRVDGLTFKCRRCGKLWVIKTE